ncbi:hypothetical protein BKA70DRAFT_1417150 [Coprinopsis sp. MPI-PUGE-AT-0042]|nr:hypothetical protein BKA70DRAFT_1417150 [Coprinopsis sp. MPI-PUGE-AT-0042]
MSSEVHLPLEVWSEIIRNATQGTQQSGIWQRPSMTATVYGEWKSSMVTKSRVVRVCKDWYSIGIPFLYEHIVVKNCERIYTYIPYVSQTSAIDQTLGPLGRFTKRLDIGHDHTRPPSTIFVAAYPGLVLHLPNLRAFVAAACRVTHDLLKTLPPSLEHFEYRDDYSMLLGPLYWREFLTSHPNLRSAVLPELGHALPLPISPPFLMQQLAELRMYRSQFETDCLPMFSSLRRLGVQWRAGQNYVGHCPITMPFFGPLEKTLRPSTYP